MDQEAESTSQSFKQTKRTIGSPGLTLEFFAFQKLGKLDRFVQILDLLGQSVHQEEDVAIPCDAVTDSGALEEKSVLPAKIGTSYASIEVFLLTPEQVGFGKQIYYTCKEEQ